METIRQRCFGHPASTHYFRFTNMPGNADAQYISGEAIWVPVAPGR
jgi:hypothetical protein